MDGEDITEFDIAVEAIKNKGEERINCLALASPKQKTSTVSSSFAASGVKQTQQKSTGSRARCALITTAYGDLDPAVKSKLN